MGPHGGPRGPKTKKKLESKSSVLHTALSRLLWPFFLFFSHFFIFLIILDQLSIIFDLFWPIFDHFGPFLNLTFTFKGKPKSVAVFLCRLVGPIFEKHFLLKAFARRFFKGFVNGCFKAFSKGFAKGFCKAFVKGFVKGFCKAFLRRLC